MTKSVETWVKCRSCGKVSVVILEEWDDCINNFVACPYCRTVGDFWRKEVSK